jgi:hypothetical protein
MASKAIGNPAAKARKRLTGKTRKRQPPQKALPPVTMNIPDDSSINLQWGQRLVLYFTESCWVDCDHPDAFLTSDGEEMPDGQNCDAGNSWGPGNPQAPYKSTTVTIRTSTPRTLSGAPRHMTARSMGAVAGPHPIHIGG